MEIFQFFRKLRNYLRVYWLSVSAEDKLPDRVQELSHFVKKLL
jgi:hypothetical protein